MEIDNISVRKQHNVRFAGEFISNNNIHKGKRPRERKPDKHKEQGLQHGPAPDYWRFPLLSLLYHSFRILQERFGDDLLQWD